MAVILWHTILFCLLAAEIKLRSIDSQLILAPQAHALWRGGFDLFINIVLVESFPPEELRENRICFQPLINLLLEFLSKLDLVDLRI